MTHLPNRAEGDAPGGRDRRGCGIVDRALVGVLRADPDGRIVAANPQCCRMLGYDEAELLGRHVLELTDPACAAETREALARLRAGSPALVLDKRYRRKDGSLLPARTSVSAVAGADGNLLGMTGVVVDLSGKLDAEAALRRSERRYRELFERIDDGFCVIQMLFDDEGRPSDYRFLEANPAFERETGLRNAVGRRIRELAPELEEHWFRVYGEIALGGEPVRFMQHARTLGERWFDVYAFRTGEPAERRVAILFRDVSSRVQTELALLESEARLRHLANAVPAILWSSDAQGVMRYVSERWSEYSGQPHEQALALGMADFLHPDDRERSVQEWARARAAARPYEAEMRLRRHDGAWRWFLVRARPQLDARGRVLAWHGSSTDIHDQKRTEEALRLSEQRMALAIEVAKVGTWELDVADGAVRSDARARELWGLPADAPENRDSFLRGVHPDDRPAVQAALEAALSPGGAGRFEAEFRFLRADGSERWVVARGQTQFVGEGERRVPLRLSGSVLDVTERHASEQVLREANQRKDEFLATLAHELRNPLAPLRNSLHLLRLGVGAEHREQLQGVMERQVAQLGRLVDDLLEVSRITRGKITLHPEPVTLDEVVQRAVETSQPLFDAARHALAIELPQPPLLLQADPVRLAQVLANLLNNAAKYTEPGGRVTLCAHRDGDDAVVVVRDNGVGIAPEHLPHVFDLFAQADRSLTRAQGGLGIGLTLVRSLVELHGGSVQARSAGSGQGSEFELRLPLRRLPATGDAPAHAQPAPDSGERRRLLVVDDNREHADTLALYLRMAGHQVRVAYDGLDGVAAVAECDPEAVLLDVGMPGLDGYEAARRIRALPGGAARVLVALTGWGQAEDRRRSHAAGFDAHLVKPADPPALLALIDSLLRLKRAAPAGGAPTA